ncbi:hypothetical protein BLOT_009891 [Blomia tropicalis]|nr:hypothetical protein BLOT_009891 [Blomia tropicalis]
MIPHIHDRNSLEDLTLTPIAVSQITSNMHNVITGTMSNCSSQYGDLDNFCINTFPCSLMIGMKSSNIRKWNAGVLNDDDKWFLVDDEKEKEENGPNKRLELLEYQSESKEIVQVCEEGRRMEQSGFTLSNKSTMTDLDLEVQVLDMVD